MKEHPETNSFATRFYRAAIGDVPLSNAMVAWNPANRSELPPDPEDDKPVAKSFDGRVLVIPHPDRERWSARLVFISCDGACDGKWRTLDPSGQMLWLLRIAWGLVVRDGLDANEVHEALLSIPEYRVEMQEEDLAPHSEE